VLADKSIEAVVIATREDTHKSLAIEALDAGKHVYVEKPLAETEIECQEILAAQQKAGVQAAVGFNRRFAPAYAKAQEILWSRGGPRMMHYRIADEFWLRVKSGMHGEGRRILVEDCHIIDLLAWMARSEPTSVYCASSRPDEHVIVLQFASGCVASLTDSGYVTRDMPKELLEATAETGAVTVEDFVELNAYGFDAYPGALTFPGHTNPLREAFPKYLLEIDGAHTMRAMRRAFRLIDQRLQSLGNGPESLIERKELERMVATGPHFNYFVDKGWKNAMRHFARCILGVETPGYATARDGLRVAKITEAAIRSAKENRAIVLA
jgi:predicted dehydrogenase